MSFTIYEVPTGNRVVVSAGSWFAVFVWNRLCNLDGCEPLSPDALRDIADEIAAGSTFERGNFGVRRGA